MKRSDMIKIIDQCVYDYTDDDFMIEKPSEFVYELLSKIEEAGMLPPYIIEQTVKKGFVQKVPKWEPEDE